MAATGLQLITDPIDLKLGPDNDLLITDGDLSFVSGVEGVAQECRIALQLFEGEVFFDTTAGIPYFNGILGAKPAAGMALARSAFEAELRAVTGVRSVLRLDVSYDRSTRTLRIVWQVNTIFGDTEAEEVSLAAALEGI